MHKSFDEFKFRPDTDTNTRVICPCASEKLLYNVVSTLAPSFLIGSSSYLQGHLIYLILAGKEDMHESLDEFEFRQICNRVSALD